MEEKIEVDFEEYKKQRKAEIMKDPEKMYIEICVPKLDLTAKNEDILLHDPFVHIESGEEGANVETVASAIISLDRIKRDLLKDFRVLSAYMALRLITTDKDEFIGNKGGLRDDTTNNSKR